jgi:hypothetical protein
MRTHYFRTIDEAYQVSLKVEENIERKTQPRGRGFNGKGKVGTAKGSEKEEDLPVVKVAEEEMKLVEAKDLKEESVDM